MSTNYSLTAQEIITQAFGKLSVYSPDTPLSTVDLDNGMVNLNLLIKYLQAKGFNLWLVVEQAIPLVATQATYLIGPTGNVAGATNRPIRIIDGRFSNTTTPSNPVDSPLIKLSRQEYDALGDKNSAGQPTQFMFDLTPLPNAAVTFYPVPDSGTVSNGQCIVVMGVQVPDLLSMSDIPYFPNEWLLALVWGLAEQLLGEYPCPADKVKLITAMSEKYITDMEGWGTMDEEVGTFFQPDYRGLQRG